LRPSAPLPALATYPKYSSSEDVDRLSADEHPYLNKICLDYCGFGLISYLQSCNDPDQGRLRP
jgi:hypothetical protein